MKRIRLEVIVAPLCFGILSLFYTIGTLSFIQKDLPKNADFRWFYGVGMAYRIHGSEHGYDLDLAAKYQAEVAGLPEGTEMLFVPNHPPFVYPLMALLSNFEYGIAYQFNFILSFLFFAPVLIVVFKMLKINGWAGFYSVLMVIGLLLFEPFYVSVLKGQDTYLLYAGGLFLLCGWSLKKDWLAGMGLGLMLIRPQIALMLALPFLFSQRRIWWWFVVAAFALALYSFAQVRLTGALGFFKILLLSTDVDKTGMYNLAGLLFRWFPGLDSDSLRVIGWSVYAVGLITMCVWWGKAKALTHRHLVLAIVLSLFTAPYLHYHDLALLAVAILGLAVSGARADRLPVPRAAVFPALASVMLLIAQFWDFTRFTIPYVVMAVLPILAWRLKPRDERETKP